MEKRTAIVAVMGVAILACVAPEEAPVGSRELAQAPAVEVILDARADGAILGGRLRATPPRTDADRVVVLRASDPRLDGAGVIDARFVEGGVAVIGADRVLRVVAEGGVVRELDREVYGPLSVAGHLVAYVRGGPPDLELMRADVRTGVVEALTQAMAPVWSPALSSDGSEVVFVSGIEGTPRLFRLDAAGALHALPPTERTPSAPSAPRWSGSTLVFEDEHGIAWLDLDEGVIEREVQGAHGLSVLADGALAATIDGEPMTALEGGAR